ncbi:prepilin peptidase [Lachnospiraceae bacterium 62-35]
MIKIIGQIVFISFLTIASWQDIKSKSVALWVYGLFGSAAYFLNLCRTGKTDWQAAICGIVICLLLLLTNRMTEGAIGEGDGYFFIVTGIFLGVWKNIVLFCGGVIFCGCCCMGMLAWGFGKHISMRKKTVPFLPFLMPVGIWLAVL